MVSPIFLSKPSEEFSTLALLRGVQIGLLGEYRSLQNPELFRFEICKIAIQAVEVSLLLQVAQWFFLYGFSVGFRLLKSWIGWNLFFFEGQQWYHVGVNLLLVSLVRVFWFREYVDHIFLKSMKFLDEKYSSIYCERLESFTKLVSSDQFSSNNASLWIKIRDQLNESPETRNFLKDGLSYLVLCFVLHVLCMKYEWLGPLVLTFVFFRILDDKVGSISALVIALIVSHFPSNFSLLVLMYYWGGYNLSCGLLSPYFDRINLSKREKVQWIKSRGGILLGFGLFHLFLINTFPWLSIMIDLAAQASVAYLVNKLTDPPPQKTSQLIDWNLTQLVLDKEKQFYALNGSFILEEGFLPFPGSSLIYPPHY